jgi:outer membrane protein assembly factor BamB
LNDKSRQLWNFELPGPAGASPVVWADNIFLTSVDGSGADGDPLFLLCVSTDGKLKWKQQLDGENRNSRDGGNSASPSPCTDGEHVWAMMTNGILSCFDLDGKLTWKQDLQSEYGEFQIQFGMTSTPILDKGVLYIQLIHGEMQRGSMETSTGWVIALDAKTGKEIWKHERKTDGVFENRHAYTSPVVYRDDRQEFLLTHGSDYLIAHSLKNGSELWRCGGLNPKGDSYNMFLRFVASPACSPGLIVCPSAKNGPVLGISVDGKLTGDISENQDARRWRLDRGTPDVASPVVYDGLVYLARENGVLVVVDAKTGEEVFQKRMFADRHRSTPVAADGKIFVGGREGSLTVLAAGREPKVLAEVDLGDAIFASPAISNRRVYVRTNKALYAFGMPGN